MYGQNDVVIEDSITEMRDNYGLLLESWKN